MIFLPAVVAFAACLSCAALALLHVFKGNWKPQKTFFVATVLLLALIEFFVGVLFVQTLPRQAMSMIRFLLAGLMFLPVVGVPFFMLLGQRDERTILKKRSPFVIAALLVIGTASLLIPAELIVREIHFAGGYFWGATFSGVGHALAIYVLLATILSIYFFDNTWRLASIAQKATMKYPYLGVATLGLSTLVVFGRVLAIPTMERQFVTIHSVGVVAFAASFMFATMRYRLFDVQVYIGREVASSFVTVVIAGVTLLGFGLVSYLAKLLGVPYDKLTLLVLGIFALFALVAVMISGRVKRRIRRYVDENFYLNRYDYRTEWRKNANMMTSSESVDEFLADFINSLCDTVITQSGYVWIEAGGGKAESYGGEAMAIDQTVIDTICSRLKPQAVHVAVGVDRIRESGIVDDLAVRDAVLAVAALGSGPEVSGVVLLGPKALGLKYTEEDRDFLSTLADQASLVLENFQMAEKIVDSRQIDVFNRFSSFVVHDLKNTVGMLSLTAENAKHNINDAEFQRDAMDTIRRSVDKMQRLIHSLGALGSEHSIRTDSVDLASCVEACVADLKSVADARRISLEFVNNGIVQVNADVSAVERIVENLVINALDASPEGSSVKIEVVGSDNAALIRVVDNGSGFDTTYLRRGLFRPFQSTKKEGLGIGLSMCKTLAEAHGGRLTVTSEAGSGATVTVRLPASD